VKYKPAKAGCQARRVVFNKALFVEHRRSLERAETRGARGNNVSAKVTVVPQLQSGEGKLTVDQPGEVKIASLLRFYDNPA
jgi:hypothetical protein